MSEKLDEDRVEHVAKALYDSAVQTTIEAIDKKTIDHELIRSVSWKV